MVGVLVIAFALPFSMASLTPGVLSKLIENAGNKDVKVIGEHRSPLLQVIEIIPALEDDPFRSRGFFLKLSDSLHSAYVSISDEDLDLIFSDKIQLGQFVYVSRFDLGSPVPVVCGLKAVPKRRPCVGSPKDLVSSDLLQVRACLDFKKENVKGSKNVNKDGLVSRTKRLVFDDSKAKLRKADKLGNKRAEGSESRRLSLDSARRVWDHSPMPKNRSKSASGAKAKESFRSSHNAASVAIDKNVSSMKHPSFSTSPLGNKNDRLLLKPVNIPLRKDFRSSTEGTVPCHLVQVPLDNQTWSNRMIPWDVLPPTIQNLGKEAVCQRTVAFSAAIRALEEASAFEAVIYCLQTFTELCNSSQKVSAGSLVEKFLEVHQSIRRAAVVVQTIINKSLPEAKSSTFCSINLSPDVRNTLADRNATSWVHAAIETDLSKFSLFRKPEKSEIVNGEKYHYVILENTPKIMNCENHFPENRPSHRNHSSLSSDSSVKRVPSPTKQHLLSAKKMNPVRKECSKGSGLKKAASLAENLLSFSHQWFLKYLEDSLNMGFGLRRGEESSEIACLLGQLKKVNKWLDDLARSGVEADDRIEGLRKKLYRFLLEHVDSAVVASK